MLELTLSILVPILAVVGWVIYAEIRDNRLYGKRPPPPSPDAFLEESFYIHNEQYNRYEGDNYER